MAFTYAEAISRIDANPELVWTPGLSSDQKLQRLNEVLDKMWRLGSWDGLLRDISLKTIGGIITLDGQYRALVSLAVPVFGWRIKVGNINWRYSASGPAPHDWTQQGRMPFAFDLGDVTGSVPASATVRDSDGNLYSLVITDGVIGLETAQQGGDPYSGATVRDGVTGVLYTLVSSAEVLGIADMTPEQSLVVNDQVIGVINPITDACRQYQVTGNPAWLDTLTFRGIARRRYNWAADDTVRVLPDNYDALLQGVRAFHWRDVGDNDRFDREFLQVLKTLEQDEEMILGDQDTGNVAVSMVFAGSRIRNLQ